MGRAEDVVDPVAAAPARIGPAGVLGPVAVQRAEAVDPADLRQAGYGAQLALVPLGAALLAQAPARVARERHHAPVRILPARRVEVAAQDGRAGPGREAVAQRPQRVRLDP